MTEYTFFWQSQSPFSNWYKSDFTIDGITFCCNEQYMMYQKARLFNDNEIATKILATTDPKTQKALGRKVKNFNQTVWNENAQRIVKEGCMAKFSQNPELKQILLDTGTTTIVEASPFDKIWGIGMRSTDPRAQNSATWNGTNWLGYILTEVRNELLAN